jgi:hypothetical protein
MSTDLARADANVPAARVLPCHAPTLTEQLLGGRDVQRAERTDEARASAGGRASKVVPSYPMRAVFAQVGRLAPTRKCWMPVAVASLKASQPDRARVVSGYPLGSVFALVTVLAIGPGNVAEVGMSRH